MKNITKTTTKTILIAIIAVGIVGSVGLLNQESFANNVQKGKDIIVYETVKKHSPDRERMNEIARTLNNQDLTESEKNLLYEEANEIRQKVRAENAIPEETRTKVRNAFLAIDAVGASNPDFASAKMFDILVGFGTAGDKVVVDIRPEHFTDEKLPAIISDIRKLVGDKVDIEYAAEEPPHLLTSCTSRTSTCDPLQGGVSIEGKNHGACSATFQADDNGNEGFITAGHCVDAGSGTADDVFQPTESGGSKIGDVNDNAYDSDTKCDCAFVQASSISDKIFSNIAADGIVSTITMNDYVTLKGKNSVKFGQVSDDSYSTTIDGTYHRDHFKVDEAAVGGDSGGPGYETNEFTPLIHGVISFGNESTYTGLSKAKFLDDELSGVDWDFS